MKDIKTTENETFNSLRATLGERLMKQRTSSNKKVTINPYWEDLLNKIELPKKEEPCYSNVQSETLMELDSNLQAKI